MGGVGDSPAPVGDSPTETTEKPSRRKSSQLAGTVAAIPFGESPDGTGGSPMLPKTILKFSDIDLAQYLGY